MRTPEQLAARKVRRQAKRYFAEHPPTPKAADPLANGVVQLRSLLITNRQSGLTK